MRVEYLIILSNLFFLCNTGYAEIVHVPATYLTIQEAIDQSIDGDTVLVAPGLYYETIHFNGRNIVVGSHFLLDNDTSYIRRTIIDADHRGQVVRFDSDEDSTAHLCGFTIRNGGGAGEVFGRRTGGIIVWGGASPHLSWLFITQNDGGYNGGAVYISEGSPLIEHVTITDNSGWRGTGIRLNSSSAVIRNSLITGNDIAANGDGGGLHLWNSSPTLENVVISENRASRGGGVYCEASNPVFRNVRIAGNTALDHGGGIFLAASDLQFDEQLRSSIYLNQAPAGRDFYIDDTSVVHLYADSLTVLAPTENDISPLANFMLDVREGVIERVSADLYVDPTGSDDNSGLSAAAPLQTIAAAMARIEADSLNPRSVFLADGNYSPSTTGELFPVIPQNHVTIDGTSRDNTILDAEGKAAVIRFSTLSSLTIRDLMITGSRQKHQRGISGDLSTFALENLLITENPGGGMSLLSCQGDLDGLLVTKNEFEGFGPGGLFSHSSDLVINASSFIENSGQSGGVLLTSGSAVISGVEFIKNDARGVGGGLYLSQVEDIVLNEVVFRDNSSFYQGGGLFLVQGDTCFIYNSLIENNSAGTGGGGIATLSGSLFLSNTTIRQNRALNGGGVQIDGPYAGFENVSINRNIADEKGGGIFFYGVSSVDFSAVDRSSIYLNGAAQAADIYAITIASINVVLDTFSVPIPTSFHAEPVESIIFDIQTSYFNQVAADLYVNPTGDDFNDGLSASQPLRTISAALSRIEAHSSSPRSIFLADGIYSPAANGEQFPLNMLGYVNLTGTSAENTILDAANKSRVLGFNQDSSITVENLTIRGGNSYRDGGGLQLLDAEVDFNNIILTKNHSMASGGGMSVNTSDVSITGSKIIDNSSDEYGGAGIIGNTVTFDDVEIAGNTAALSGGGLYLHASQPLIKNSRFEANMAFSGGGLYLDPESNPELSGVTIKGNLASYFGGGIYFEDDAAVIFDENNRTNIYFNRAGAGNDLYADVSSAANITVTVDTFTVMNPTDHHALTNSRQGLSRFSWEIQNGRTAQVAADLYVNPDGDDQNNGLTPRSPLASINMALTKIVADKLNPATIYLAPGIYADSSGNEIFPLNMNSHTTLAGSGMESTTLDGKRQKTVLFFHEDQNAFVQDVSLINGNGLEGGGIHIDRSPHLGLHRLTISNSQSNSGGGIFVREAEFVDMREMIIKENSAAENGGGLFIDENLYSIVTLRRSLIVDNIAGNYGGGIYNEDSLYIFNSTISGNEAPERSGVYSDWFIHIANSIVWDNYPGEVFLWTDRESTSYIAYSNIKGGRSGVELFRSYFEWQEGNIATDPQFRDPASGNYYLESESPAINAGTDLLLSEDGDTLLYLTPNEYFGVAPDMGAFEDDTTTAISRVDNIPLQFELYQNYPNPFNPTTRIPYSIANSGKVTITLYDILGRKVKILHQGYHLPGNYMHEFNARGLASGVYFYRLQMENGPQLVRKMLLLR